MKKTDMEQHPKIGLVATDLDGTLLRRDKSISPEDWGMLEMLGERQIIRAIATGRNFRKVKEVIPENAPFDYVAFSSGAGIYDCRNNELVFKQNIPVDTVNGIVEQLVGRKLNFYLFRAVPENSYCWYYRGEHLCPEFERYYDFHRDFASLMPVPEKLDSEACQFLVIFETAAAYLELKHELETHFPNIRILRASSPLDTGYIWMEIFHHDVSKGHAIRWLCDKHGIPHQATFSIGNDYNDLDLLDFTSISYLVENSPDELKNKYLLAPSNEDSGFSASLRKHFNLA